MAEGSIWEAFEHAGFYGLDNLTAIIDVNRLGQRGDTMHGWDLDAYAAPRRGLRLARHRDRRPRRRGDRRAPTPRPAHDRRPPDRDRRPHHEGQGRRSAVENQEGRHGKPLADPDDGDRGAGRRARPRRRAAAPEGRRHSRTGFDAPGGELPTLRARATRSRPARPTARRWRRSAPRAATSSPSTARSATRPTPRSSRKAHPDRFFEMYIAEQQMVAAAVGMQVRGWTPVRLHVRGVPHPRLRLRPHGRRQPGEPAPVRLARGRVDRRGRAVADGARGPGGRSARSTAAPCSTRATPTRRRSSSR